MASGEDRVEPESKPLESNKDAEDKYNVEAAEIRANEALVGFLRLIPKQNWGFFFFP